MFFSPFPLLLLVLLALPLVGQQVSVETVKYVDIIDLFDEPVEVFADLDNVHSVKSLKRLVCWVVGLGEEFVQQDNIGKTLRPQTGREGFVTGEKG